MIWLYVLIDMSISLSFKNEWSSHFFGISVFWPHTYEHSTVDKNETACSEKVRVKTIGKQQDHTACETILMIFMQMSKMISLYSVYNP